jgi:hypothetical protein
MFFLSICWYISVWPWRQSWGLLDLLSVRLDLHHYDDNQHKRGKRHWLKYMLNKTLLEDENRHAQTAFRMLSHFISSTSVRRSLTLTMALFNNSCH